MLKITPKLATRFQRNLTLSGMPNNTDKYITRPMKISKRHRVLFKFNSKNFSLKIIIFL